MTSVYENKNFDMGISSDDPDLNEEFMIDTATINMSTGGYPGLGPRYGMAPIPGHQHNITPTAPTGLRQSEGSSAYYSNRLGVTNLLPVRIGTFADIATRKTHYVWVTSSMRGTVPAETVDFAISSSATNYSTDFADGLYDAVLGAVDDGRFGNRRLKSLDMRTAALKSFRSVAMTIAGSDIPVPFFLTKGNVDTPDLGLDPGSMNFCTYGWFWQHVANKPLFGKRKITMYGIFTDTLVPYHAKKWLFDEYNYTDTSWTKVASIADTSTEHWLPGTADRAEARATTPSYTDGQLTKILVEDEKLVCNSGFTFIASAPNKACCAIIQEQYRDADGGILQWVDLINLRGAETIRTLIPSGASSYTEGGTEKGTGWKYWPAYVPGTALQKSASTSWDGTNHVALGAANTGILRKDTIYEVAFSLYDATINYETNVSTPAKILTSTDDFVCLYLFRNKTSDGLVSGTNTQRCGIGMPIPFPMPTQEINGLQYRVYYRVFGTQEWIPGGAWWCAQIFYDGTLKTLSLAAAPLALLPGGAPGAFTDYSNLPNDSWKDVIVFGSRLFWMSEKQLVFSMRDNPLAYPLRNSVSCPVGSFRGIMVHAITGESARDAAIVIFGSEETYIGRFLGAGKGIQAPVTVSPTTTALFELDGSDFNVIVRSSITAFSAKAACSGDGMLYYWGPSGIYEDTTTGLPTRINIQITPWIDDIYDPGYTDQIFAVFNDLTSEVIWFFKPKTNIGFATEALVFHRKKRCWNRFGFQETIDWASAVSLEQDVARRLTAGKRLLIGVSNQIFTQQRAYFFDSRCQSGDLYHGYEFLVSSIASKRMTLAPGYDVDAFANIEVGQRFTIAQALEYSENSDIVNQSFTVTGKGTNWIDTDTTNPDATFTSETLLPIYQHARNGIRWKFLTSMWAAGGIFAFHEWTDFFMTFRVELTADATINLSYKGNNAINFKTRTLTMIENSDSYYNVWSQPIPGDEATAGQGFQVLLEGEMYGGRWRLEYMNIMGDKREANELRQFEG